MSRRRVTRTLAAPAPAALPRPRAWHVRMAALVIVAAGAAAYANSLSNPLVIDDRRAILENPQVRALWPPSIPLNPPDDTPVARRPLVNLSFAVNYAIHGVDVRGYHFGNLLIHLGAGVVLFGLVRRTLMLPALRASFGAHADGLAAAAALLWTLHPLHTEIVNYVSQRTTALMGLSYLLTLYCSVRAIDGGRRWHTAAIAACAAGMASKESMVTAPVLVALFDRALVFDSWREGWHKRRMLYVGLGSTWLLLWAVMASGARTSVGFHGEIGAWTYLLNQAPILARYLRLVVWPTGLVVDYGPAQAVTLTEVLLPAVLIATLAVVCLVAWWHRPRAAFLPLASFLLLAPTSSVVPIVTEAGAERRMYLPAAALVLLAVCAVYRAGITLRARAPRAASRLAISRQKIAAGVVASTGIVFAMLVVERNREFATPIGLARTSLDRWPHGRSHLRVGNELLMLDRRDEALWHMRRATEDFPDARYVLGTELLAGGDLDNGMRELRAFVERLPQHAYVRVARGMIATALALQQRYDEAASEFRVLLEHSRGTAEIHAYLGEALLRGSGHPDEAVTHLEQAAALRPTDPRIRNLLGTAFALMGEYDAARQHFLAATRLDPHYEPARASLTQLDRMKQGSPPSQ
jgi:protein O-mannosyl-transferase